MTYFKQFITMLLFTLFLNHAAAQELFTDLHGHRVTFSSFKGKWVLINYWASWCQPCLDEIKELNKFYALQNLDTILFAVNFDELPAEEQLRLVKKLGIRYPNLLTDPKEYFGFGDIRGVPATFVINPEGQLSATLYGSQTLASLNKATQH